MLKIPRIIHQLWIDLDPGVPMGYRHWQRSWQDMHPDFEYRMWTNRDIERFIDKTCPEWSDLFYGYKQNICRVDLARYLILQRFGGLYVDLDFECLRPHHDLLAGHTLLMGLEPGSHAALSKCRQAGLNSIVCNAWMASVPDHPFWNHLLQDLQHASHQTDVLELTGPFVLTRSVGRYRGEGVSIVPARHLYPVDKDACWKGEIQDLEFFESATREAHALHHWVGSWFRPQQHLHHLPLPRATAALRKTASGSAAPAPLSISQRSSRDTLISCLMVTRGDPHRLRHAIRGFQAQTHPRTELVIVTDKPEQRLQLLRSEFPASNIRWVFIEARPGLTLGELRNRSIDAANGDYVAQWDDDDLHDPSRLQHQLGAILAGKAHAVLLTRWTIWWPQQRRLFISGRRTWEGSLMCERSLMPRYPALSKGEDTPVIRAVMNNLQVALLDAPRLYTYVIHGHNTWDVEHFEKIYQAVSADFSGPSYARMRRELARRVDVDGYLPTVSASVPLQPRPAVASQAATPMDSVLILTPMRNTHKHLARYFELVGRLTYPPNRISLGILEGDSTDGTFKALIDLAPEWRNRLADLTLVKWDSGQHWRVPRWHPSIQHARRANLARVRNRLLNRCLKDHEWVLWIDADVIDYPPDLIEQLMAGQRDIAAACCIKPDGSIFDHNTFIFHPNKAAAERDEFLVDGLFQPPTATGRRYLDSAPAPWVPVDGVGGTALLIRGNLHRQGLNFPTYSYKGYIETEGLAAMARDMGVECWGARDITVTHVNE
jgi:glycosyltransferase involved in cell wall biosynthesis